MNAGTKFIGLSGFWCKSMEKKHLSQSLAPMKHDLGILRKDGDDKYLLSLFKRGGYIMVLMNTVLF